MNSSRGLTIRWQSNVVRGRAFLSEATTNGPKVIFCTKWPSITSTWSTVPLVIASLRKALPSTTFDCHLMIEHPDEFIPAFAEAGASWISVHQEACVHLHRTLQLIESHGCKSGVVLNPAPPVYMVDEVRGLVHPVLVMSVNPGFGAQKFIPGALQKIKTLAEVREELGLSYRIEVDGGVALDTVADVVRAGAELLVAGNAVFAKGNIRENAQKLLEVARSATLTRA